MAGALVWVLVGVAALIGGVIVVALALDWNERRSGVPRLSATELADQLERLARSSGWEENGLVDELECVPIRDDRLDLIRARVVEMLDEGSERDCWFTPEHRNELRQLAAELRGQTTGSTGA